MPRIARTLLSALVASAALAGPASAADYNPGAGNYTANTTTLKLAGGPGGSTVNGTDQGGVAVFTFDNVNIGNGVQINAEGSRPFKLVASGNLTVATGGLVNGNGASATDYTAAANSGGPGGGEAGTQSGNPGAGPGGGGAINQIFNGGGGGGFGGTGARGGVGGSGGTPATGGPAYGNLNASLQGGSGGGGAYVVGGGGGGGGVALFG